MTHPFRCPECHCLHPPVVKEGDVEIIVITSTEFRSHTFACDMQIDCLLSAFKEFWRSYNDTK